MNNIILRVTSFVFVVMLFVIAAGCDDSGTENNGPTTKNNPNVRSFDSIWVEEDSIMTSLTGLDLLNGVHTTGVDPLRDASLISRVGDTTYSDFYLRSGIYDLLAAGYQSRWFRPYADLSKDRFDTISHLDVGSTMDSLDFTQETTEFWGYFNAPLTTHPVYCFWLNGKKYANLNNGKDVYGILWPIEATDNNPGSPYGYKMSFRVRININGENDFRKIIPAD